MNTCAPRAGSFLDQQAHRLGYSIEDFSQLALKSTTAPRVAGRCSVFAKTDMIHCSRGPPGLRDHRRPLPGHGPQPEKQYRQGQDPDPAGGLPGRCGPQSGGAPGLPPGPGFRRRRLLIPPHFCALGAVGAVLVARENRRRFLLDLEPLRRHLQQEVGQTRRLAPCSPPGSWDRRITRWWRSRRVRRWRPTWASTWAPSAPTW